MAPREHQGAPAPGKGSSDWLSCGSLAVQGTADIAGTEIPTELHSSFQNMRAAMCILKVPVLLVLSVTLAQLKATPLQSVTSHQADKRKCNTATCATQRLANFLVRSSNNFGTILYPTNVGSNAYGKRDVAEAFSREPLLYLPQ